MIGVTCWKTASAAGTASLRLPRPRPSGAQIYFIGATNVPMERLDPALTRPGRMGRHVNFRTPTKEDRKDIFDLYLDKVAHDPELDTPERRDEIARITNGYSPAMIDQICSMALTNAHHEGKATFGWEHLVDAMVVIESGSRDQRQLPRGRRARDGDPRGRPRRGRARLPARPRVEPALDQDARRLARPPPVVREGRALRQVPERPLRRSHPHRGRDGRRARLLRREHERRRRRSAVRDIPRRGDGGRGRDVAAAARPAREDVRRRERGADRAPGSRSASRTSARAS